MTTDTDPKIWKTIATFSNYEEAANKKKQLLKEEKHALVKIKRGGKGGGLFRVKAWNPPTKKSNNKKKT